MESATSSIGLNAEDQIRRLTDLRADMRALLAAHPQGVWFKMLPKVFQTHFQRDMDATLLAIPHPLLFLDYISDLIKFELPINLNDEDFIIELNDYPKQLPKPTEGANGKRERLVKTLAQVDAHTRGAVLREICMLDENGKVQNEHRAVTHEEVVRRLQKIRSMVDFSLRRLLQAPTDVSADQLVDLYGQCNGFIAQLTPLAQHLSSSMP